ncbi:MAG: tRNA (adenosine(37)-N6)-dimethylallyltransferase MiaA [Treponema sp.]|nr:tRNA (adenosine(37)-N6)-dimethylallyltransferase MiaA [Treponema sp.]
MLSDIQLKEKYNFPDPLPAKNYNLIVVLGPTAVGKTSLGVRLAHFLNTEIISADSRQVYRHLDLGSGKDLAEYTLSDGTQIQYHLIDITDLSYEYNVFDYQTDFYRVFGEIAGRGKIPVVVGGTGMYLDSFIRNYDLVPVPENPELRAELEKMSLEELDSLLLKLRPDFHTTAHLRDRNRVIRHIEIKKFMESPALEQWRKTQKPRPALKPLILGTTIERPLLRANIEKRLKERFEQGMIEEVAELHKNGASWERLESLGLEYKFISEFLEGKISDKDELFERLNLAIGQFAKRQETWFRGMEKKGVKINWLPSVPDGNIKFIAALDIIKSAFLD